MFSEEEEKNARASKGSSSSHELFAEGDEDRIAKARQKVNEAESAKENANGWSRTGDALLRNNMFADMFGYESYDEKIDNARKDYEKELSYKDAELSLKMKELGLLGAEKDLAMQDTKHGIMKEGLSQEKIKTHGAELAYDNMVAKDSYAQSMRYLEANPRFNNLTVEEQKKLENNTFSVQQRDMLSAMRFGYEGIRNGDKRLIDKGVEFAARAGVNAKELNGKFYIENVNDKGEKEYQEVTPEVMGKMFTDIQAKQEEELNIIEKQREQEKSVEGSCYNDLISNLYHEAGNLQGAIVMADKLMKDFSPKERDNHVLVSQATNIFGKDGTIPVNPDDVTKSKMAELDSLAEKMGYDTIQTADGKIIVKNPNTNELIPFEKFIDKAKKTDRIQSLMDSIAMERAIKAKNNAIAQQNAYEQKLEQFRAQEQIKNEERAKAKSVSEEGEAEGDVELSKRLDESFSDIDTSGMDLKEDYKSNISKNVAEGADTEKAIESYRTALINSKKFIEDEMVNVYIKMKEFVDDKGKVRAELKDIINYDNAKRDKLYSITKDAMNVLKKAKAIFTDEDIMHFEVPFSSDFDDFKEIQNRIDTVLNRESEAIHKKNAEGRNFLFSGGAFGPGMSQPRY